jgi:predicted flap endonuclease-1-like 5' DNA nuclease
LKIKSIRNIFFSEKKTFIKKKENKERFETKKSKKNKNKKDNLRLIEGVGPKIESLLEREGINSFKKLSNSNVDELQLILKKAGDRYAFHNPTT